MPAGLVPSEAFENLLPSTCLASGRKKKKVEVLATQLCPAFLTLWTVAHQAPLLMEFYKKGYWSGLSFSSSGYLPDSGIKSGPLALQADFLPYELPEKLASGGCQ